MKKIMKKSMKFLLILIFFVMLFYTFNNSFVYAEDFNAANWEPNPFPTSIKGETKLQIIGNKIVGAVQVIGSLVSVIAIIIIGIKYMLGSVEEKAQYKETLGPYFLGAVFVFGITNVVSIIYDIAKQI